MKITKQDIMDVSIDLFAEHGLQNVTLEQIADKLKISEKCVYHYVKGGKDEIVDDIIMMFDDIVKNNTPREEEWMDISSDVRSVLSKLFFMIKRNDLEKYRKINRIIFSSQHRNEKIKSYILEDIYEKREDDLMLCFDALVQHGKVKPFNTASAASILNQIFISYSLEYSYHAPCNSNEFPASIINVQNDCMLIVKQIINGTYSND